MQEPTSYRLNHATGTVDLTVSSDRLVVKSQGKGLLDKPRTIDIPLSELKNFCVTPTIAAQQLSTGDGTDQPYDSELIFSYHDQGNLKKKRLFVFSQDTSFQNLLETLKKRRPDASLLHLEPKEAQKQIGVMYASTAVYIIVGLLVGIPVLIALIVVLSTVLGGK